MRRVVWLVKKQASLQMLATNNLLWLADLAIVVCIHFYSWGKAYFLHWIWTRVLRYGVNQASVFTLFNFQKQKTALAYNFKKREVENTTRKTNFELLDAIETFIHSH